MKQAAIDKANSFASLGDAICFVKSAVEHGSPQGTSSPMRRPPYIPIGVVHIRWKITIFHNPSPYLCFAHGPIRSTEFSDFADEVLIFERHTRVVILVCHVLFLLDNRPLMKNVAKRKSVAFHKE